MDAKPEADRGQPVFEDVNGKLFAAYVGGAIKKDFELLKPGEVRLS